MENTVQIFENYLNTLYINTKDNGYYKFVYCQNCDLYIYNNYFQIAKINDEIDYDHLYCHLCKKHDIPNKMVYLCIEKDWINTKTGKIESKIKMIKNNEHSLILPEKIFIPELDSECCFCKKKYYYLDLDQFKVGRDYKEKIACAFCYHYNYCDYCYDFKENVEHFDGNDLCLSCRIIDICLERLREVLNKDLEKFVYINVENTKENEFKIRVENAELDFHIFYESIRLNRFFEKIFSYLNEEQKKEMLDYTLKNIFINMK